MSKMQNPFIWHDLMTKDVEAAKKFYADVVGWTFIRSANAELHRATCWRTRRWRHHGNAA